MRRPQIAKLLFWSVIAVGLLGGAFLTGLYSGARKNNAFAMVRDLREKARDAVRTVMNEAPILVRARPEWHLQPGRHAGSGVTINETSDDELILLSGFFGGGNQLRLIRRDGSIVARWPLVFSEIFADTGHIYQPPASDWNTDTHGALIEPDGSVVFVFEYMGLVKLDRCGRLEWKLAEPVHHSVDRAATGGYWVPGRNYVLEETRPRFPPFNVPYFEDTVLRISESGKILAKRSIVELLYRSGMKAWVTMMPGSELELRMNGEILHLNTVAELETGMAADFPMFAAGDLLLSVRELNMILVTDPELQRVKWWRVGPWLRQHDPEFKAGGLISVFNNNTYKSAFGPDNYFNKSHLTIPRVSNILEVDPATDEVRRVYGGVKGQELLTVIRGKHELTARGGLLVTEFEAGRVFETDSSSRVIWEYVNRFDEDEVAEITEARVYPADYFNVADWSCARKVE
jgi:Arylsulfotransferase (ASST)